MKIKVFTPDFTGHISFTKEELQQLLDEVYKEGYEDGSNRNRYWYWSPYYTNTISTAPTITLTSSSSTIDPNTITAYNCEQYAGTTFTSTNFDTTIKNEYKPPESYKIEFTDK